MATLTGTQIKNTYDSVLKLSDNTPLTNQLKEITDGIGSPTPLSVSAFAVSSSATVQAPGFQIPGGTSTQFLTADGSTSTSIAQVQSDWNATSGDAFILNKPTITDKFIQLSVAGSTINEANGIGLSYTDDFANVGNDSNTRYLNHYGMGIHKPIGASFSGGNGTYMSGFFGVDLFTGGQNRLHIEQGGDIGIGTTTPDSKLHIYANNADAPTVVTIENGDTSVVAGQDLSKIEFLTSDVSTPGAGVAASIRTVCQNSGNIFDLAFNTQHGSTRTEKMRLDGLGNLGIGTTDPTSKLQVIGLPSHSSNAAAITAGLTVGAFYHTSGTLKVVI